MKGPFLFLSGTFGLLGKSLLRWLLLPFSRWQWLVLVLLAAFIIFVECVIDTGGKVEIPVPGDIPEQGVNFD